MRVTPDDLQSADVQDHAIDVRAVELGLPTTRAVAAGLAVAGGVILALGLVAAAIQLSGATFPGHEGVTVLLSLSSEFNIPTIIAVLWLASCSAMLMLIATLQRVNRQPFVGHWRGLSVIFAYLALDEGARIHERLNEPLAGLAVTTGFLRWGWVLVGGLAVLLLVPVYARFVLALPARARAGTVLAGTLYVGGALVMESIGAFVSGRQGLDAPLYIGLTLVEETMEFAGVGLFIVVLWWLLRRWAPVLVLHHPRAATTGR